MDKESYNRAQQLLEENKMLREFSNITSDFYREYPEARDSFFEDLGRTIYTISQRDKNFYDKIMDLVNREIDKRDRIFQGL